MEVMCKSSTSTSGTHQLDNDDLEKVREHCEHRINIAEELDNHENTNRQNTADANPGKSIPKGLNKPNGSR